MNGSSSLVFRMWAATAAVAVTSVSGVAIVVRAAFRNAFIFYLEHQQMMAGGRRMSPGLIMAGATEQEFQRAVDQGIFWSAIAAIMLSFVVAYLLARAVARPLERLTVGAQAIAAGDLDHRVPVEGPAEVERLGVAFNEMALSLDEAETLRRRMVADVAHELRNPVAAVRAQTEGMAEGILPVDAARLASLVEDAAHLSRLVDDLHELSVAEAGQLSYEMFELDLSGLVEREVARAAAAAPPSVSVRASCAERPALVLADEGRISQVLRNLLGNALRHTAHGEITVSCELAADQVVIRVTDTGEGIPEADLPYVFERFYRADAARAKDTGGTGIGLAVARRIVEDHGGSVFAQSVFGQGAVVGFGLPSSQRITSGH